MRKPPACVQCRRRKIGCDRAKPMCGNCVKTGKINCFYPDIPGRYVPSSSVIKAQERGFAALNGPNGQVLSQVQRQGQMPSFLPNGHVPSSTLTPSVLHAHFDPELATLDQLREYNTKLQLLNTDESLDLQRNLQVLGGTTFGTPDHGTMDDLSAGGSLSSLNWVQGPAVFDQTFSPYTQEEVIRKEIEFLKSRLLELQEITGKKIEDIEFLTSTRKAKKNDSDLYVWDSDFDSDMSDVDQDTGDSIFMKFDEFRDVDPEFLDSTKIFTILSKELAPLTHVMQLSNSIFTSNFLVMKDGYLHSFRAFYSNLIDKYFQPDVERLLQMRAASLILSNGKLQTTYETSESSGRIVLPAKEVTEYLLQKFFGTVKELPSLIPIIDLQDLTREINESLGTNPIMSPQDLDIDKLTLCGCITILILLFFDSLSSSILLLLREQQLEHFNQVKSFLPVMLNNLKLIKRELENRPKAYRSIATLRFVALYKFYEAVTSLSESDGSSKMNGLLDYDEDMHLALQLSLNCNESQTLLWNFICRNYCQRHIFRGEVPLLLSGFELSSTRVQDPLLVSSLELMEYEVEMLQFLSRHTQLCSLERVVKIRETLKPKFDEFSRRCVSQALEVHKAHEFTTYMSSLLFIDYFLMMQYEALSDTKNFTKYYQSFLASTQSVIFHIFSSITSKNFAGYEFYFINHFFITLSNLSDMLLGMYQRCHFGSSAEDQDNKEQGGSKVSELLNEQADNIELIIRKILILLEDYSRNCKRVNPFTEMLAVKIKTLISYISLCEKLRAKPSSVQDNAGETAADNTNIDTALQAESRAEDSGLQEIISSLSQTKNIMTILDEEILRKLNNRTKSISESLIMSNFYKERKQFQPSNPEMLDITSESFPEAYEALG